MDIATVTAYLICKTIRKVVGRFAGLFGKGCRTIQKLQGDSRNNSRSCKAIRGAAKQFEELQSDLEAVERFAGLLDNSQGNSKAAKQFRGL